MRRGGAALAFADAEDEWTREDEQEVEGLVAAEGEWQLAVFGPKPVMSPMHIPIWELEGHGERVAFHEALILHLAEEVGEGVYLESPELRIWGMGKDQFAALRDFSATFVEVLRSYESTPNRELSSDAVDYVGKLKARIARREAV